MPGKIQTCPPAGAAEQLQATYFEFSSEKILEIARGAADLGVEMLVLDDGWFGKRDDDTSGLGDWYVNEKKLARRPETAGRPDQRSGLEVWPGLSRKQCPRDSDLYRAHPDWAIRIPQRRPNRSRYQLILDMSRQEVRDYLYERICAILDSANIEYVKWDMNRNISDVYSTSLPKERQGEVCHRYMLGLYECAGEAGDPLSRHSLGRLQRRRRPV
ncbi:MAG: alpha-galactosidase [Lachnospiraceae bacterium]